MQHKSNNYYRNGQDQLLFDTDEFIKRPSPDHREFVDLLTPVVEDIEAAVKFAQDYLLNFHSKFPKHYSNSKLDAHLFNCIVIGKLKDLLGREEFGISPEGRDYLQLGRYVVFIKKVNDTFEPSNIPTVNAQRINAQYASTTEEPKSVMFIGYRGIRGDLSSIEGVYAIHIDKEQNEKWVLPLSILRYEQSGILATYSEDIMEQDVEQRVKVKKVLEESL